METVLSHRFRLELEQKDDVASVSVIKPFEKYVDAAR